MDPKLSGLDPKLQDAYKRVMGTPVTPASSSPTDPAATAPLAGNTPPIQTQSAPPQASPTSFTPPSTGFDVSAPPATPATPAGSTLPPNTIPGVNSTIAFNANDKGKNQGTTEVKSGGHHLMPIFVGVAVVFLLVAYTFVWIILFNVNVPFLPQL